MYKKTSGCLITVLCFVCNFILATQRCTVPMSNRNRSARALTRSLLTILLSIMVTASMAQQRAFRPKKVYKTKSLIITQVSAHCYEHTSFKQTNDFGYVPCNGLIVRDDSDVIIFDTPTNDAASEELLSWVKEKLHCTVKAVIPTHFHDDCLGGLKAFHDHHIPSYAYNKTIVLAGENHYEVPQHGFSDSLVLPLGHDHITARFLGEGHTKDNIVGYFAPDKVMFGGCLIKEMNAQKGYLGDANLQAWSGTVEKVKQAYPGVQIVVPGHGNYGNARLLDYTITLFKTQ